MKQKFMIYGAGYNAGSIIRLYESDREGEVFKNYELAGLIDDTKREPVLWVEIVGTKADLPRLQGEGNSHIVVSLYESPVKRLETCLELDKDGFKFVDLQFQPVPRDSQIGKGTYIDSRAALMGNGQEIGDYCSIANFASIEGGVQIEKGSIICPHVFVGMESKIGEGTVIYPGAVVNPRVTIGKRCVIGSSAVQHKDLPDDGKNLRYR